MAQRASSTAMTLAAVMLPLAIAGCSMVPDLGLGDSGPRAPANTLAPAPAPVYAAGDQFVYDDNGTITEEQVVSTAPDRVVWTNDSGLIWTKDTNLVTPQLSWSAHPELGRGRQTIIGSPNQLFPLREGNVIAYTVRGSSETVPAGWQDEHRCIVAGQQDVEVKAGAFTTFRIDCQRKDFLDVYYYSPVVQNYVLRDRQFANRTERKELVSVTLANDRTSGLPVSVQTPPTPIEGKPMTAPAMADEDSMKPGEQMAEETTMDAFRTNALVTRLEDAVSRLEKLAGMDTAGEAMAKASGDDAMAKADHGGPWAVHLSSYRSQKGATDGWKVLQRQFPSLRAKSMRTSEFDSGRGRGTYIRLMAVGFPSKQAATDFCRPIVAKGQFCQARGPLP